MKTGSHDTGVCASGALLTLLNGYTWSVCFLCRGIICTAKLITFTSELITCSCHFTCKLFLLSVSPVQILLARALQLEKTSKAANLQFIEVCLCTQSMLIEVNLMILLIFLKFLSHYAFFLSISCYTGCIVTIVENRSETSGSFLWPPCWVFADPNISGLHNLCRT